MSEAPVPLVGLITLWYSVAEPERDRFLRALAALRHPRLQPVFVIHRQSAQEVAWLRSNLPQALVLEPGANLGTAAGWNLAIERLLALGADYVGVLNTDVEPDPRYLERLLERLEADRSVGAASPLLLYSDERQKVQMFGGGVDLVTGRCSHDFEGATALERLPEVHECGYLDGGTLLVRAEVLREVGSFDERFFLYYEDADLSVRIRAAGWRLLAVRDARAWHYHREQKGPVSPPYQVFYETRNRFLFLRKHAGRRRFGRALARAVLGLPRRELRFLRERRGAHARAYALGVVHGGLGQSGRGPEL